MANFGHIQWQYQRGMGGICSSPSQRLCLSLAPSERKMAKISYFWQFLNFCPLRYACCPLDAPPRKIFWYRHRSHIGLRGGGGCHCWHYLFWMTCFKPQNHFQIRMVHMIRSHISTHWHVCFSLLLNKQGVKSQHRSDSEPFGVIALHQKICYAASSMITLT